MSRLARTAISTTRYIVLLTFDDVQNSSRCPIWDRRSEYNIRRVRAYFVFHFLFCIVYLSQTQQTAGTAHKQFRVRAATSWTQGYIYTPAVRQHIHMQDHALPVFCPCCIALGPYCCTSYFFNLSDPAICRAGDICRLCCCAIPQWQQRSKARLRFQ